MKNITKNFESIKKDYTLKNEKGKDRAFRYPFLKKVKKVKKENQKMIADPLYDVCI